MSRNGRGGITNLYNVYMDGNLLITFATAKQVQDITGCRSTDVAKYSRQGFYHKNGHKYKFDLAEVLHNKRPRVTKSAYRDNPIVMYPGFEDDWDKYRMLAKRALRSPRAVRKFRMKLQAVS